MPPQSVRVRPLFRPHRDDNVVRPPPRTARPRSPGPAFGLADLATVGLTSRDVIIMKGYLKRPAGAADADYTGWNRAYRWFFANVDLATVGTIPVPTGTGAPAPPRIANAARPARVRTTPATHSSEWPESMAVMRAWA